MEKEKKLNSYYNGEYELGFTAGLDTAIWIIRSAMNMGQEARVQRERPKAVSRSGPEAVWSVEGGTY